MLSESESARLASACGSVSQHVDHKETVAQSLRLTFKTCRVGLLSTSGTK